jgi:hypothetical protein
MDISDIFEIYDIKKIGGDGQVLVTLCTTEFRGGGYDVDENGLLILKQVPIGNDSIEGDKYQFVLDKNTASANIVEEKLDKVQSVLSKKGPDIKFERQVIFLNKIKSNLISWFLDSDNEYPFNIDDTPAFILADGYGSATLNGVNYALTKPQGAIIKVLYRSFLNKTPLMLSKDILLQAEELLSEDGIQSRLEGDKISDIFKSNRLASEALIIREGQSHYRLNL